VPQYPSEPVFWAGYEAEVTAIYAEWGIRFPDNAAAFRWFSRPGFDIGAGLPEEQAKRKHLAELRAALQATYGPPGAQPPVQPLPAEPPTTSPTSSGMPARLYRNPNVLGGRALCKMGTATPEVLLGVSAFRACELVLTGKQGELETYANWCVDQRINYVRVFLTARNMFELQPQDGLNMLPVVLEVFGSRGIYVEAVLCADLYDQQGNPIRPGYDWTGHVAQAGSILQRFSNGFAEIDNEPAQVWQRMSVQMLATMAATIPAEVPVSLGAADGGNDESMEYVSDRSTYATVHGDRNPGAQGWRWCRHTKEQMHISEKSKLHAFDDERNRDMSDPAKHFAVSAVERVCHLGGLFHSEGGKHCRIPVGDELACFQQTRRAWDFMPAGFFGSFANTGFSAPNPVSPVQSFTRVNGDEDARCYATVHPNEAYMAAIRAQSIEWRTGWRIVESIDDLAPNAAFYHVVK
jgi:hypothetical protein